MASAHLIATAIATVLLAVVMSAKAEESSKEKEPKTCVFTGSMRSTYHWVGNMTDMDDLILTINVSFPPANCCPKLLFFNKEQKDKQNSSMTCTQKENLVDNSNFILTIGNNDTGCQFRNESGMNSFSCSEDLSSYNKTAWFLAMTACNQANTSLSVNYTISAQGVGHEDSCEGSDVSRAPRATSLNVIMLATWCIMVLGFVTKVV